MFSQKDTSCASSGGIVDSSEAFVSRCNDCREFGEKNEVLYFGCDRRR